MKLGSNYIEYVMIPATNLFNNAPGQYFDFYQKRWDILNRNYVKLGREGKNGKIKTA